MSAWVVTTLDAGMPVSKPDTGGAYSGHLTVLHAAVEGLHTTLAQVQAASRPEQMR